ncbi:MAG: hypothetical protein HS115_00930 [Spirochaetales bacterium]|nr:hypothetical protein [Spirochaetales bacterium]
MNVHTGEIKEINFMAYRPFFIQWREAVLRHLVRSKHSFKEKFCPDCQKPLIFLSPELIFFLPGGQDVL